MYGTISYVCDYFKMVFQTSVTASILIGLILIIRKLTKGKLGIRFQYALWFVIILRLLIPKLPQSMFSVFNIISTMSKSVFLLVSTKETTFGNIFGYSGNKISAIYNQDDVLASISSINFSKSKVTTFDLSVITLLALIWFLGILVICIYLLVVNIRLKNKIKSHPEFCTEEALIILECCKKQMKIKRNVILIKTQEIKSPALLGHFKPIILLPKNILEVVPINKLKYVFFHELSHLKRKDMIMNWAISILRVIHWFNPIVQYGLKKMTEDMEICCDSLALSYTNDEDVKEYGLTIINLIDHFSKSVTLLGTTSIVNNKSEVRRRIVMIKLFNKKAYKFSALAIVLLMILGAAALTDAKVLAFGKSKVVNVDKIDFPFVNDPQIVGKWKSVDFVEKTEDFKVDSTNFKGDLFVKELNFTSDGKVPKTVFTWTKDHILDPADNTDSRYEIKDIAGSTYMFFEWKSGDYTIKGLKPQYYVLKKISSTPSLTSNISGKEVKIKIDKIDYPFVNDSEVIGKWQSIDFIEKIENFMPKVKLWKGDLYLDNLTFKENGIIDNKDLTWTKNLVINAQLKTATKYTVKEIDGSKYMFFEWKSGDYTERGATPWYYVLKQVK